MLLVRVRLKNLVFPKLRTQVSVGCLQGVVHCLDEVTHSTGMTTGGGVAITDSSHEHELLSSRGGNKSSTTRGRDEPYTNGTRLSSYLTWHGVWRSSLTSPVSTTYRSNIKLGSSDSTTDSSCYLRGTLNSKTNVSIVISQSNECLETSTLTSTTLLLNRHNLHNLLLQLILKEEVDNLCLLHRERVKENLLNGVNLSFLHKTTKLGYRIP
mmetsp:Transcript_679/g.450  ORF Transcript_679/g.450 Transcript_679/m.450 type:complete len:211 (-) Transcript_679:154-786(-)